MNIALVGYGSFGKKYYSILKKLKKFDQIYIFKKKRKKNFFQISKKNLKKYNIKFGIIATPVETHFTLAKLFIENKIPIILEKPAANNYLEVKKLKKLSLKYRTNVIVNYSDLFNLNFISIINQKNLGKIQELKIIFGKQDSKYRSSFLPFSDWFPHILAIYFSFFRKIGKIHIKKHVLYQKKKINFQTLLLRILLNKDVFVEILYSNSLFKKKRKVFIKTNKFQISYDGYKKFYLINKKKITTSLVNCNNTSLQNIILKLYDKSKYKKYYSNLDLSLKIHKLHDQIKYKIY